PGSASVPEPGSALMAASASLLVGLGIRKRVR
ncbi:PEP-CTERM sorting domain-containing protein, partial [Escherichia coli]